MSRFVLEIANLALHALHSGLILFVLLGWWPRATRRAHRAALAVIAVSWLGLGAFYGLGYCFLTNWHWQVLSRLGSEGLPHSYTALLAQRAGWNVAPLLVDLVTAAGLVFGCTAAAVAWWRDRRNGR